MDTRYVETLGEIHENWMIDLLAGGGSLHQFKLLCWDGKEIRIDVNVVRTTSPGTDRTVYRPRTVDPTIARAIYFPARIANYESTESLLSDLANTIKKFGGLADDDARLLGHAVLASWLVEFTEVPICVGLIGPPSPERRQLLRLLRCLFRRGLVLGEATLAGLSSLPMEIAPTLLVERCEPTAQFLKFLEATTSRDTQMVTRGRIWNACCAKVLCSEESFCHAMPAWPVLEISVCDRHCPLPSLLPREQGQIADDFQPKLQMFRLTNHTQARDSAFDLWDAPTAVRELARCLGACLGGDVHLQSQLSALLKERHREVHSRANRELHSMVVRAVLLLAHKQKKNTAGVAEITTMVNKALGQCGEPLQLTPRALGSILRALGFTTQRLGAPGRGIVLLNSVRQRIHELASEYKIGGDVLDSVDCQYCEKFSGKEPLDVENEQELVDRLNRLTSEQLENPFQCD